MGGKADLKAAFRALLEQGREEMEPPTPEELIAYREGLLSAEEKASVEERLAVFPEAARALRDLARFPDLEPPSGVEPLSEERVRKSWEQFRSRLESRETEAAEETEEEAEETGEPAGGPAQPGGPHRYGRSTPPWWRALGDVPRLLWASTGALAAVVFGWSIGLLSAPSLLPVASKPEAGVPVVEMTAETHLEREAGPPRLQVAAGSPVFLVLELPPGPKAPSYEIEIDGPGDRTWTGTAAPSEFGDLHLTLPSSYLTPGEVEITARYVGEIGLADTGAAEREPAVYRFEVR